MSRRCEDCLKELKDGEATETRSKSGNVFTCGPYSRNHFEDYQHWHIECPTTERWYAIGSKGLLDGPWSSSEEAQERATAVGYPAVMLIKVAEEYKVKTQLVKVYG